MRAPQLKLPRGARKEREKQTPSERVLLDIWDVGAGPHYYDGKLASTPEWRVLKVLAELGWTPEFQVTKFGGRSLAGGQVLDILVTQRRPLVYIDVRSYWHKGAAGEANDARKIFQLRASAPEVKVLVIWEEETENRALLRARLLSEVGAHGR